MRRRWAQVIDVEVIRKATEWPLPGLECRCCGVVTFAGPPPGAHAGPVSYGPVLNAAAVVLTGYGNVLPERAAQVMAMLLGAPVSPGWVDKASGRLAAQVGKAGFEAAMLAALAGDKALAADETPVNVLDSSAPRPAGAVHPVDAGGPPVQALHRVPAVFGDGRVLPHLRPGRRPRAPTCRPCPPPVSTAESPALWFTHSQFEALLTAARQSPNSCDFALVAMLGLLGLRIFEAISADIADLGEERTAPTPG